MLKEFWYNGEATNDESGGKLGGCPQSYGDHVVAYVGGAGDLPGVVCSQGRRYASAEVGNISTTPVLVDTAKTHVAATTMRGMDNHLQ